MMKLNKWIKGKALMMEGALRNDVGGSFIIELDTNYCELCE